LFEDPGTQYESYYMFLRWTRDFVLPLLTFGHQISTVSIFEFELRLWTLIYFLYA